MHYIDLWSWYLSLSNHGLTPKCFWSKSDKSPQINQVPASRVVHVLQSVKQGTQTRDADTTRRGHVTNMISKTIGRRKGELGWLKLCILFCMIIICMKLRRFKQLI